MSKRKLPPTATLRAVGLPARRPSIYQRPGSINWYVKVHIPPSAGLGDKHIERSLRTADRSEALRRLPIILGQIRTQVAQLTRNPDGAPKVTRRGPPRDPEGWARWWREQVFADGGDPDVGDVSSPWQATLDEEVERRLGPETGVERDEDGERPTYEPERERDADELFAVAVGRVRLPDEGLERYIAERRFKPRYAGRIRRAVARLRTWMRSTLGVADTRRLDKRRAAEFVDYLAGAKLTTATVNSLVSALATYWSWMEKRGLADRNPWREQQRRPADDEGAIIRAFDDQEATRLLNGDTSVTLHDLMRLAALSGMRINEIARLRVRDVQQGYFDITEAKTKAGIRQVPIHPHLMTLVDRRKADKAAGDFLIEELKAPGSRSKERSAKASERFTAYRRACGVDERRSGQRVSNVNFHSWRHWFVTKALQAGHPPHLVSAVVGHEAGRSSMTLKVYDTGCMTPARHPTRSRLSSAVWNSPREPSWIARSA
jgi:integrase